MFVIPSPEDADSPWPIFERIRLRPELSELSDMMDMDVRLAFMLRSGADWKRGPREVLGACYIPTVQGELRLLFDQLLEDALGYYPDFLIILNGDWWAGATEPEREVLLFHELLHCGHALDQYGTPKYRRDDGRPVICIKGHDVEEFAAVVERYGAWKGDLREFLAAFRRHEAGADTLT